MPGSVYSRVQWSGFGVQHFASSRYPEVLNPLSAATSYDRRLLRLAPFLFPPLPENAFINVSLSSALLYLAARVHGPVDYRKANAISGNVKPKWQHGWAQGAQGPPHHPIALEKGAISPHDDLQERSRRNRDNKIVIPYKRNTYVRRPGSGFGPAGASCGPATPPIPTTVPRARFWQTLDLLCFPIAFTIKVDSGRPLPPKRMDSDWPDRGMVFSKGSGRLLTG